MSACQQKPASHVAERASVRSCMAKARLNAGAFSYDIGSRSERAGFVAERASVRCRRVAKGRLNADAFSYVCRRSQWSLVAARASVQSVWLAGSAGLNAGAFSYVSSQQLDEQERTTP